MMNYNIYSYQWEIIHSHDEFCNYTEFSKLSESEQNEILHTLISYDQGMRRIDMEFRDVQSRNSILLAKGEDMDIVVDSMWATMQAMDRDRGRLHSKACAVLHKYPRVFPGTWPRERITAWIRTIQEVTD